MYRGEIKVNFVPIHNCVHHKHQAHKISY